MTTRRSHTLTLAAAVASTALVLSACSSGSSGGGDTGSTGGSGGSGGGLKVATGTQFPPMEYITTDTKKLTGFDIDLGNALAKKMGTKITWVQLDYNQFLSSLKTGRVNMILGGMGDTKERQGQATFVDYLLTGTQLFTSTAQKGKGISSLTDLCGKTVAASENSNYKIYIDAWSKKNCQGKGKPAIKVLGTDGSPAARLQLKQGRAVAVAQTSETVSYQIKQEPGSYVKLGGPIDHEYYGMGFATTDSARKDKVVKALNALIDDGTYGKIAKKWGVSSQAIKKATVNLKPVSGS